ncbi:unnamed protein product, partial [Prorocentrum cordatum]
MEKMPFFLPAELAGAAFAFGNALDVGVGGAHALPLLAAVAREGARSAFRLEAVHLAGLLQSCVRWRPPVPAADLARFAEALQSRSDLEPAAALRAGGYLEELRLLAPCHGGDADAAPPAPAAAGGASADRAGTAGGLCSAAPAAVTLSGAERAAGHGPGPAAPR